MAVTKTFQASIDKKAEAISWIRSLNRDDLSALISLGILNQNEVRVAHDLTPVEGGDENTINTPNGPIPIRLIGTIFEKSMGAIK